MTYEEFCESVVTAENPPDGVSVSVQALWYDRVGNWEEAHRLVQDHSGTDGAWVHAYLHRKEGDLANARYWYRRSNRPEKMGSLDDEWEQIVRTLLQSRSDP